MTKADLVEQVADAIGPGLTKKDCALVVDGFLNAVKQALAQGDRIEIRGFGTFETRSRKARMARNPRTGDPVAVPARSAPVFKPSKHFRSQVAIAREAAGGGGEAAPDESAGRGRGSRPRFGGYGRPRPSPLGRPRR